MMCRQPVCSIHQWQCLMGRASWIVQPALSPLHMLLMAMQVTCLYQDLAYVKALRHECVSSELAVGHQGARCRRSKVGGVSVPSWQHEHISVAKTLYKVWDGGQGVKTSCVTACYNKRMNERKMSAGRDFLVFSANLP